MRLGANTSTSLALFRNFLGDAPNWYKQFVFICLIANPVVLYVFGPYATSVLLLVEFIFILANSLLCYPLQPAGLIVLEAVLLGMTTPERIEQEALNSVSIIPFIIFIVAAVYFTRDLWNLVFIRLIISIESKTRLAVSVFILSALLSAFLDAITVAAILATISMSIYSVLDEKNPISHNDEDWYFDRENKDRPRARTDVLAYLQNIIMHGLAGTAVGGASTLVGEPQNILIASAGGWGFAEYFWVMLPMSLPVFIAGVALCLLVEKNQWFHYGRVLSSGDKLILKMYYEDEIKKQTRRHQFVIFSQLAVVVFIALSFAFEIASVGMTGLAALVILTSITGINKERSLGAAFSDALPFTGILIIFFCYIAIFKEVDLIQPIIDYIFGQSFEEQKAFLFLAIGALSSVIDNLFVSIIYLEELDELLSANVVAQEHLQALLVDINFATNIPSLMTPNGQAALLFVLTSEAAFKARLSYIQMVYMAMPYTIGLTLVSLYWMIKQEAMFAYFLGIWQGVTGT